MPECRVATTPEGRLRFDHARFETGCLPRAASANYIYCGLARYDSKTLTIRSFACKVRFVLLIFHYFYIDCFEATDFSLVFMTFAIRHGTEKLGVC